MPNNNPLLVFSIPVKEKRTALRPSFFKSLLHTPFATKQDSRLGPKFDILRRALEAKNLLPQTSTLGLEPECTVVMEIIGSLENFISITRNIEGLEWLAEFDNEEIEPDDDFYLVDKDTKIKNDKKMKSKLFVTMATPTSLPISSIAPTGQINPQLPQPWQSSPNTSTLPLTKASALYWQTSAHLPQAIHFSVLILGIGTQTLCE